MVHKKLKPTLLTAIFVIGSFILFAGCAGPQSATITEGVIEKIPENANRIVLIQEQRPPASVYVDMIHVLRLKGYDIRYSEENMDIDYLTDMLDDEPLVFTARKQVNDDLALWIKGNVEMTPGGGKLVASVNYAENVNAAADEWKNARWTDGQSKLAFFEGLETLRSSHYDALDFEVGVMVTAR